MERCDGLSHKAKDTTNFAENNTKYKSSFAFLFFSNSLSHRLFFLAHIYFFVDYLIILISSQATSKLFERIEWSFETKARHQIEPLIDVCYFILLLIILFYLLNFIYLISRFILYILHLIIKLSNSI